MKNAKETAFWTVCLLAVALAGAAGVGLIRDFGSGWLLKLNPPLIAHTDAKLASAWLDAVAKGDQRRAVAIAARIAPESESFILPCPEYLGVISDFRIRLGFLTDPFNFADYARWRDLLEANALSRTLKGPPEIFDAVMKRVGDIASGAAPLNAMDSWRSAKGTSEDRARLLCALSMQQGYACRLIGLPKERGVLLKTLCHLRKGSESWLADTESGILLEASWPLSGKAETMLFNVWKGTVPASALKGPFVFFALSEPQDFRLADKLLYERLRSSGAEGLPVLPCEPKTLFNSIVAEKGKDDFPSYWHLPFQGLRSIKGDPGGWLLWAPKK